MTDSRILLAEYVERGSEPAFRELVARYIDLVYSAAVRLTDGDTHRAEDVAQTVFADLARLAPTLSNKVMLGGWLHRRTCHVAATIMRSERRRQSRESQAVQMNALQDHSEGNLVQIAATLDQAIDKLGADDRTAILLRFFEQRDFRAIGQALGSNEDAAQKRVSRALGKLHSLLRRQGFSLSAAALGTALATEAVSAAPAGLAVTISSTALASASVSGATTLTLLKIITMTKFKLSIIGAAVAIGTVTTPLLLQHRALATLREENALLQQQAKEKTQLAAENQRLTNQLVELTRSKSLADERLSELKSLRAKEKRTPAQTRSTSGAQNQGNAVTPSAKLLPASSWENVGTATPESSWQTLRWALAHNNLGGFTQAVAWDPQVQAQAQTIFDEAPESTRQKFGSIDGVLYAMTTTPGLVDPDVTGFRLISKNISGDEGTLTVEEQKADGQVKQHPVPMHNFDDGWRIVLPPKMLKQFGEYLNSPELWPKESIGKQ